MLDEAIEPHDQPATLLAEITASLLEDPDPATTLALVIEAGTRLFAGAAVGIVLVDPRGGLQVGAASDERSQFLELLQSQIDQGPCVDCIAQAQPVVAADLHGARERWPEFTPAALQAGYRAVHAVPMQLDHTAVGGVNLLYPTPRALTPASAQLARILADLAVLALLAEPDPQQRSARLASHTITVLHERVTTGQAVGIVAGGTGVDVDTAWQLLWAHARHQQVPVRDVVRALIAGTLNPADLAATHHQDQPGQSQSGSAPS
ncbi:GAF and ANTAR domain-containing protein [Pseudonocardia parietis]|uniref:Transcriptional regulator with GAF, ATPase, and Fis domain n=1 Tax=Pseudonocardia parietis TaxID=570936 RepID=A0ABS4W6W3_9PSEU|nr:GAF and ANTAR domain-containing protein [Pseudonocardia parietis]MBP2371945.1 transcriptional regulator with GAF, ATPase, and Fis domain [Pseudonocardia parietis]